MPFTTAKATHLEERATIIGINYTDILLHVEEQVFGELVLEA